MSRRPFARSRATLVLLAAAAAWRLAASVAAEAQIVAQPGAAHRWRVWTADLAQRQRWTLQADSALLDDLRPLVAETPRVVLYGAATGVSREAMGSRLDLLTSQFAELLFPARVQSLVGPLPDAAFQLFRPGMPAIVVVNVTPTEPLPAALGLTTLLARRPFTIQRMEPR